MKKNKIFGIGATVLMILVTVIPAVNGMNLNIEKINDFKNTNQKYDLEVTITSVNLISNEPRTIDGKKYSIYRVDYKIENVGKAIYPSGKPLTEVLIQKDKDDPNSMVVIDDWHEDFKLPIAVGGGRERSKDIEVRSSNNADIDYDRYFADHEITLHCDSGGGEGYWPNNFDTRRIFNFWRNEERFMPTTGQVLGTTPFRYEEYTKEINGVKYTVPVSSKILTADFSLDDLIDIIKSINVDLIREKLEELINFLWKEVPTHFKNHRLGYVSNVTYYMSMVSVEVLFILLRFGEFLAATWDDFKVIAQWIRDVATFFSVLISTGTPSAVLAAKMIDEPGKVINALTNITSAAVIWGGKILDGMDALTETLNKWMDWRATKPWLDKIRIYGRVDELVDGETIDVNCKNGGHQTIKIPKNGRHDDDIAWFDFNSNIDPNDHPKRAHDCTITVTGNEHDKDISTISLLSYCFSGGEVYHRFVTWPTKAKNINSKINLRVKMFEIISFLFKDRPVFSSFNNLIFQQKSLFV